MAKPAVQGSVDRSLALQGPTSLRPSSRQPAYRRLVPLSPTRWVVGLGRAHAPAPFPDRRFPATDEERLRSSHTSAQAGRTSLPERLSRALARVRLKWSPRSARFSRALVAAAGSGPERARGCSLRAPDRPVVLPPWPLCARPGWLYSLVSLFDFPGFLRATPVANGSGI